MRGPLRAVVALSGGVDSSVAAALLVKYGRHVGVDVVGAAHMTNWSAASEADDGTDRGRAAPPLGCGEEKALAAAVADRLQLPFHHCEFEADFFTLVFRPTVDAFRGGGSANPDCVCNRVIKFDRFATHARRAFGGADVIVTGHYARNRWWRLSQRLASLSASATGVRADEIVTPESWSGAARPLAAATNDQSYFLSRVDARQLDPVLFPNSEFTKADVRRLAKQFDLPTADRPTSTGVCFIGKRRFDDFVAAHAAEAGDDMRLFSPGPIVWAADRQPVAGTLFRHGVRHTPVREGPAVAQHLGVARYTVGQRLLITPPPPSRKGGASPPLRKVYVSRKNPATNTLHVVETWDDASLVAAAGSVVPLTDVTVHDNVALSQARNELLFVARHGQPPVRVAAVFADGGDGELCGVRLREPIRAVCPGQVGALYSAAATPGLERCVAAGVIAG